MHIRHTFTNQFKGLGIIKEVQSLFVGQACLLCKQLDDTCVFALKKYGIRLHILQGDRFNKQEEVVNHSLRGDAKLMVGLFPLQLVKCLLTSVDALKIKVNGIKDLVVGNAPFNDVILFMGQTFTASSDIIKPFTIVCRKDFAADVGNLIGKLIDVQDCWLATTNEAQSIITSLLLQRGEIEAKAKVQMLARMANIRFRHDSVGGMIESHAAFRTPFLFIKSTRSSTMYSRENVCNTS